MRRAPPVDAVTMIERAYEFARRAPAPVERTLPQALLFGHNLAKNTRANVYVYAARGTHVLSRALPHRVEGVSKWFRVSASGTVTAQARHADRRINTHESKTVGRIVGDLITLNGGKA